ncbi:MAG TPA: hypothetical protein PLH84_09025 [Candidatus Krumholzibacteria bacterium]|nr:hypothetical protein [Candidatus Krumholzibacteria bacterium]
MKNVNVIFALALLLIAAPVLAQSVVINELDSDTVGTDALEFVELYGAPNASLDGLVLVFYNGSNDLSYAAFDLDGFSLDANGFFLLGNAAVVPTPSILFNGNFLQNGADGVALYTANDVDFPLNTPVTDVNLVDALVYGTSDADDAGLLAVLTPGRPQIDENLNGAKDFESVQRCNDGAGDFYVTAPSPGASNDAACASVGNENVNWGTLKSLYR